MLFHACHRTPISQGSRSASFSVSVLSEEQTGEPMRSKLPKHRVPSQRFCYWSLVTLHGVEVEAGPNVHDLHRLRDNSGAGLYFPETKFVLSSLTTLLHRRITQAMRP